MTRGFSPRLLAAAATVGFVFAALSASAAVNPPNPKDLTMGKWELNVAKSKTCGAMPKRSTRFIFDAGWGVMGVDWGGATADGKPITNHGTWRYDGQKWPAGLRPDAPEAITWKLVDPHRVEFVHWSKDDKKTAEYVRTVSADGQTMTQSAKFIGRPCAEESQVFERRESLD